jgi:hypothetical protein
MAVTAGSDAFREFLKRRSDKMASDSAEAAFFEHKGTRGVAREEVLREPLRQILPDRYGIGTGEIHSSDGDVSPQADLIVYDKANTPVLYERFTSGVYPVETALAAVSVKSTIKLEDVDEAVKFAARVRSMPFEAITEDGVLLDAGAVRGEAGFDARPATWLYGFDGPPLASIRTRLLEAVRAHGGPIASGLQGVCIHGGGIVLPVTQSREATVFLDAIRDYGATAAGRGAFGIFLGYFYASLAGMRRCAPKLNRYIEFEAMIADDS